LDEPAYLSYPDDTIIVIINKDIPTKFDTHTMTLPAVTLETIYFLWTKAIIVYETVADTTTKPSTRILRYRNWSKCHQNTYRNTSTFTDTVTEVHVNYIFTGKTSTKTKLKVQKLLLHIQTQYRYQIYQQPLLRKIQLHQ
jgi:hypothetical protein